MTSKIERTDTTWNPVTGCTKVSEGCRNCYAERMAKRLTGRVGYPADEPFRVTLHPERLEEPLRWTRPRRVFVVSMGDLFHPDVPFDYIDRVFAVMAMRQEHTFQVLTKRPERMLEYLTSMELYTERYGHIMVRMSEMGYLSAEDAACVAPPDIPCTLPKDPPWPLPNVILMTTVENQEQADKRIPYLLRCPAHRRGISAEPMLGPVDLTRIITDQAGPTKTLRNVLLRGSYGTAWHELANGERADLYGPPERIDWVICGGESGPGARPLHPDWVRSLRDQCLVAGVPFFFKGWGEWLPCDQADGDVPPLTRALTSLAGDGSSKHVGHWFRMGKKAAGRVLDCRVWDEFPR